MAILEEHFYHGTIRMYLAAFGSLFNEIKILKKSTNELIKVPIRLQMKDRQMERRDVDPDAARYQTILPRMSYTLTGFNRDQSRMKSKHDFIHVKLADDQGNPISKRQLNRVPFQFNIDLSIKTKYTDEMLQIIEQIGVWFTDNIELTIRDNPDLNQDSVISISLQSFSPENSYEGIFDDGNQIETTLSFVLDGYLYKPTSNSGLITKVTVNYYDLDSEILLEQDIEVP